MHLTENPMVSQKKGDLRTPLEGLSISIDQAVEILLS
jgi:hypothetical protein